MGDTVRVAVAEPPATIVTVLGERFVLRRPIDAVADRDMLPANPFRLVRVIVDGADPPRATVREEGLAEMLKSPVIEDVTVSDTCAVWDIDPLVPVTVIE